MKKISWYSIFGFSTVKKIIEDDNSKAITNKGLWIINNFTQEEIDSCMTKTMWGNEINMDKLRKIYYQKK